MSPELLNKIAAKLNTSKIKVISTKINEVRELLELKVKTSENKKFNVFISEEGVLMGWQIIE